MPINFQQKSELLLRKTGDTSVDILYNYILDQIINSVNHRVEFSMIESYASELNIRNSTKYLKESFFCEFPELGIFPLNFNPSAKSQIQISLKYGELEDCNVENFMTVVQLGFEISRERWNREKSIQEKNGSASTLGNFTELIVESALINLIQDYPNEFFRTSSKEVKSYGDFVVMCLPNNLWISIKSSYARERLLASGFVNDVIGVGTFIDPEEFCTDDKIRNYKKVGFLAIYLPDQPINEIQLEAQINTYDSVIAIKPDVRNINNQPFFRPLSTLSNDLLALLECEIKQRFATTF